MARAGLGPSPGWGPVRVGAHMGPYGPIYGPIWAHMGPLWVLMGPYGPIWALMGPLGQVLEKASTFRRDFWTNFARFGSKAKCLMKCLDDSASFLLEKLKNHVILTPNLNI